MKEKIMEWVKLNGEFDGIMYINYLDEEIVNGLKTLKDVKIQDGYKLVSIDVSLTGWLLLRFANDDGGCYWKNYDDVCEEIYRAYNP